MVIKNSRTKEQIICETKSLQNYLLFSMVVGSAREMWVFSMQEAEVAGYPFVLKVFLF